MGRRGQENTNSTRMWQALSCLYASAHRVSWSDFSPHPPGDSAQMSGPLQNLPSFFQVELTVSILGTSALSVLRALMVIMWRRCLIAQQTFKIPSIGMDHRDWADGGKWLQPPPLQVGVARWLVTVNSMWVNKIFYRPCLLFLINLFY